MDQMATSDAQGRILVRARGPGELLAAIPIGIDRPQKPAVAGNAVYFGPKPIQTVRVSTRFGKVFIGDRDSEPIRTPASNAEADTRLITDCDSECCCTCCCCEEPDSSVFFHPRVLDCPCPPPDPETGYHPISIGVFFDGIDALSESGIETPDGRLEGRVLVDSGESHHVPFICHHYASKNTYYRRMPWEPWKTDDLTEEIFEYLRYQVCYWTEVPTGTSILAKCREINIDIFGYSRGAGAAVHLAQLINDRGFECSRCGIERLFKRYPIRFLGVLDPVESGMWTQGWGSIKEIPGNVQNLFVRYSTGKDGEITDFVTELSFPSHLRTGARVELVARLDHGELGWNEAVRDAMLAAYTKVPGAVSLKRKMRDICGPEDRP